MVLMPTNPSQSVGIEYTPEFKRALRKLVKKYHHIRSDLQPVIMLLQKGELVPHYDNRDHTPLRQDEQDSIFCLSRSKSR